MGDTCGSALLAKVTRGGFEESHHRGTVVISDSAGRIVWSLGDPGRVAYWRSAAKPIQVVPLFLSGAVDGFGFTDAEIAVISSSHAGQGFHLDAVKSILAKIGLDPDCLACGAHPPFDPVSNMKLVSSGEVPTVLHSDCSGKHAGMLALAVHMKVGIQEYWKPSHPVQAAILGEISNYTGVPIPGIHLGIDGCGVPVFALPLVSMAMAYARICTGEGLDEERRSAGDRITGAMMSHPHMVAGTGRLCTRLMEALPGRLVSKGGAEGIHCLGLPGHGLGVACKVDDGNSRALGPILVRALSLAGLLSDNEMERLSTLAEVDLLNFKGERVGSIMPAF